MNQKSCGKLSHRADPQLLHSTDFFIAYSLWTWPLSVVTLRIPLFLRAPSRQFCPVLRVSLSHVTRIPFSGLFVSQCYAYSLFDIQDAPTKVAWCAPRAFGDPTSQQATMLAFELSMFSAANATLRRKCCTADAFAWEIPFFEWSLAHYLSLLLSACGLFPRFIQSIGKKFSCTGVRWTSSLRAGFLCLIFLNLTPKWPFRWLLCLSCFDWRSFDSTFSISPSSCSVRSVI